MDKIAFVVRFLLCILLAMVSIIALLNGVIGWAVLIAALAVLIYPAP